MIRKEVLLRGVISLSSSWVELYAVCFLSCVPVWPCCLTTVVNPRSFFFETSLCFLSNSLGWFESTLVAECWCYCFQVLFLTSRYGGLGPVCGVTGASTPPRSCLLWEESSHRQDVCCTQSNAASDNKLGPTHSSRYVFFQKRFFKRWKVLGRLTAFWHDKYMFKHVLHKH